MPWNLPSPGYQMNDNSNSNVIEIKLSLVECSVTRAVHLNSNVPIYELCEHIQKTNREIQGKNQKNYGLFLPHEDWRKGLWLDNSKTLQHYIIRNGDILEYQKRKRKLLIKTMDGTRKQVKVDDSWTVAELMLTVCSKLGIFNHDEYSLIHQTETPISPTIDKTKTLTKDQERLDKLKRKHHTEDGLNWLNPSQSLRQQGIDPDEVLLLKRKYFFSDMNVDARDPIQLNLLYVQLKDTILNGTHPVTMDEAIQLAGLQCQVEFGDFSQDTTKTGLNLSEFLPKEYQKKAVEKKIFNQHAKHKGATDAEAKEKYCLLCRSLKTYGITFFLVKEKVRGKNKLIPRLLGVNKDSVVQVDDRTKEIINKWPLTSIKKWAASFNAFTLDFGEYNPDGYYTAQTDKGEKISQLIAGYIDIILKKKKTKDHLGMDADEESVMYEENISPLKAVIVEHVPKHPRPVSTEEVVVPRKTQKTASSVRISSQASDSITSQEVDMYAEESFSRQMSAFSQTQSPDSSITTGSQYYQNLDNYKNKQYVLSLNEYLKTVEPYKEQICVVKQQEPVVVDEANKQYIQIHLDNSRQRMSDEVGAMNAAVAQLLRSAQGLATITEEGEVDENVVSHEDIALRQQQNAAITDEMIADMQNSFSVISIHLPSLIKEIQNATYYQNQLGESQDPNGKEEGEDLIKAARELADAFTLLIKAAYPIEEGTRNVDKRAILEAANGVGEASSDLLSQITEQETSYIELKAERPPSIVFVSQQEQLYREDLLQLARIVANETTNLIKQVKVVAVETENPEAQKAVVSAATNTGGSISQLIATTKIVAPTIDQPQCQRQLLLVVDDVHKSIEHVVETANDVTNSPEVVRETEQSAQNVYVALDNLRRHLNKNNDEKKNFDDFIEAYEMVLKMDTSNAESDLLIESARRLAQATAGMISNIKLKMEDEEEEEQRDKVIVAVKQLTQATTELVDSAKNCTAEPDQLDLRYTLSEATNKFILITYTTECADILQEQVINNLLLAARQAATTSTHLINTSQSAAKKSRASNYKVCNDGQDLSQETSNLIIAIKQARGDPNDQLYQLELIEACQNFITPAEQLCQSSKYMWPTISDQALQGALNQSIDQSVIANQELRKYIRQAELLCQHIDLMAALKQLERLDADLDMNKKYIEQDRLIPLPNEKAEESTDLLIKSVKYSGVSSNQMKANLEDRYITYQQTGEDKYKNLHHLDSVGYTAKELSSNLSRLVRASRGVAASIELEAREESLGHGDDGLILPVIVPETERKIRREAQMKITDDCQSSVKSAYALILIAKEDPGENLEQAKSINENTCLLSDSLGRCLESLPGHRDLEILTRHVETRKNQFVENKLPPLQKQPNNEILNSQSNITDSAVEFNQAVKDLVSAESFYAIQKACKKYRVTYDSILYSTNDYINGNTDKVVSPNMKDKIVDNVKSDIVDLSVSSIELFDCSKKIITNKDDMNQRKELQNAAKLVIEALNRLLSSTSRTIEPGQKECDKVLMKLESMRPLLDNPIHPISQKRYYECLEFIVDKTMPPLAESLRTVPTVINKGDTPKFIETIYVFADNVCWLLEETAQAAYLIGIGDSSSKIGKSRLADHSFFLETRRAILSDCRTLAKQEDDDKKIVAIATEIADNAKRLCEASKTVMASYPKDKPRITDSTKDTLVAVSSLMSAIQELNRQNSVGDENDKELKNMKNCISEVERTSNELVELLMSYKFATGEGAKISDKGIKTQEPLKAAGITVLDTAIDVVHCSRALVTQEPSDELFANYSSSCRDLNDSLKHLIATIKDSAPGQKECENALKLIEKLLREVQEVNMKLDKYRARSPTWDIETEESYQKVLESALTQIPACVDNISKAGKSEPEHLAHNLARMTELLESITTSCTKAAKHTELVQNSNVYLEHIATILEASQQYLKAVKISGGNPKAVSAHAQVDEMGQGVKDSCGDLLAALDKISMKEGNLKEIVETITSSSVKATESAILPKSARFSKTQARMLELCYQMDDLTSDISEKATEGSTQRQVEPLTVKLTQNYEDLCVECQSAVVVIPDKQKCNDLQNGVHLVGQSSVNLVKSSSNLKPNSTSTITGLQTKAKDLRARIEDVIRILIDANSQTQRCNEALKILNGVRKNVDMNKLNLKSENQSNLTNGKVDDGTLINKTKSSITTNTNTVVNNLKYVVTRDSNPRILSDKCMDMATTTKMMSHDLLDCVNNYDKWSTDNKLQILDAFHEVVMKLIATAEVLRDLCEATERSLHDSELKIRGKDSVNAITEFLKLFKEIEDTVPKDFWIIDDTIITLVEYRENLTTLVTNSQKEGSPTHSVASSKGSEISLGPKFASDEINRLLPVLSNGTSRVLDMLNTNPASGDTIGSQPSQQDVISLAKYCLKVNDDLKNVCQNLMKSVPVNNNQINTVAVASQITDKYIQMLTGLKQHLQAPTKNTQVEVISNAKQCADLIRLLYQHVESLREGPKLVMYFRPSSPEWRDVSEKYIGRHVAYHHCYVKSYKNTSLSSLSHPTIVMQIPINLTNPSANDLDNAKKQIHYVTTKLVQLQPNKQLIGKGKFSVAEIDQLKAYVKDMGQSTECLITSSQHIGKSTTDESKTLFKSVIDVAQAMKSLCELTNSALVSGNLDVYSNKSEDEQKKSSIFTATQQVSQSTQKLLNMINNDEKANNGLIEVKTCGKEIRDKADLLQNHVKVIGGGSIADNYNNYNNDVNDDKNTEAKSNETN